MLTESIIGAPVLLNLLNLLQKITGKGMKDGTNNQERFYFFYLLVAG